MEVESTSRLRIKYLDRIPLDRNAFIKTSVSILSHNDTCNNAVSISGGYFVNSLLFSHPSLPPSPFIVFFGFFFILFCSFFLFFFCSSLLIRYRLTDPRATSILKISTRTNVQIFVIRNVNGKKRFKRIELMTEEFNFSRATSILLQFDLHMVCDTFITL